MSDAPALVLVVEDEPQIRRFVVAVLAEEGYRIAESASAAACLEQLAVAAPALLVLDLGLPDRDGVDLIRELRTWSRVPVLVLSARAAENEKVTALDAGADDYLSKPFGVGELRARVRAMLRRRAANVDEPVVVFGDVRVDRLHRSVERGGTAVHLTPIEYRLLGVLIANAGRVLTHRQLLRDVWGSGYGDRNHYLRIYVGHLRQKLEDDPARPRHLLTETGIGYRFQIHGEEP
ncbi:KDP operon transcriptional regulatory protein KdpE [Rhodocyclaceae bacterium]|nr:KDP operon transcriptional regulatory protein KdpE [Rhodocyclaceae bacterium]